MLRLTLALLAAIGLAGYFVFQPLQDDRTDAPPLGVLRVSPDSVGQPTDEVTVTFDRPVAGGLDETVDATSIFRISPSVRGRAEWRDPVTLRFTPEAPLRPGARYTVTIAPTFRGMDGSRLPQPFRFTFRVARASILTGSPVTAGQQARWLPTEPVLTLLLSSDADAAEVAARTRMELKGCPGPSTVALRGIRTRRINADDPEFFRYYGSPGPDTANDLRRVVEIAPVRPLPADCPGELVVPASLDEPAAPGGAGTVDTLVITTTQGSQGWTFRTRGPLRVMGAGCPQYGSCHDGPAEVVFSTPVRGADVERWVRLDSAAGPVRVYDTTAVADVWRLEGRLAPRRGYRITVDPRLTDGFGQRLTGPTAFAFRTPGVPASVVFPHGKLIVEREGFRTLAVQHVNVDTLDVLIAAVPDSVEASLLSNGWGRWREAWDALAPTARRQRIPVRNPQDRSSVTGVRLPVPDARRSPHGTLMAVRVGGRGVDTVPGEFAPIALVQVTDLAVHARVGVDQAAVWVTGVRDGRPRGGVDVTLHDAQGRVRATGRTGRDGVALLSGFRTPTRGKDCNGDDCAWEATEGYVAARRGADRAVVGVSEYDPDLSPYQFDVYSAWGEERAPAAGAVFTERGIYRPGEPVYAKAIVRRGPLGALTPPERGDSLRWRFTDREGKALREATVALSRFGTAEQTLRLAADLPLGQYGVEVQLRREGQWRQIGYTSYQVAEYRPPEFRVEVSASKGARTVGDTFRATVGGRYLFGAPMSRAPVRWSVRQETAQAWELGIPGTEGFYVGETWRWWESGGAPPRVAAQGTDTLDARGYRDISVPVEALEPGHPSRVTLRAEVIDANRQRVAGAVTALVHPADFYVGARPRGEDGGYFWRAGRPVGVDVIAVRPEGGRVDGVEVRGVVERREWHRVRRQRGGVFDEVGEWVTDTLATCRVTTGPRAQPCAFTPREGGSYTVILQARDSRGRLASTSFTRWTVGEGYVPWNDESKFKMSVVADRDRYSVGDTATVILAAPFTGAEAWVTVERERIIEQRRIRITSGTQTLRIPITEAFAPNAFVSVVVVRGRSRAPGTVDDPGRPTLRVGYAELRVTPDSKRLAVEVKPLREEYRPGDTARVRVRLRDAAGRARAGEVTLWAVDEGVLSLTGYKTPDPMELIYQPRGLGMRLSSNLVAVAPQVPEGQKGARSPGGGGGRDVAAVLRSEFRPTAFFLGSVETGEDGEAVASARLPDNLTTFRVMAVAVTAGDRYGSGESPLLVTRPLLARPALPRFVREGDSFLAGVVVNHRFGAAVQADVTAQVQGLTLSGGAERRLALAAGRGAEARFRFGAPVGDSATFRFDVTGGGEADAVRLRIPIRPANRPAVHTLAGVLRDTATLEFVLPAGTDPSRSSLELGFGTSPLALVESYWRQLELYPYGCSEQVASQALPLIAMLRAGREGGVSPQSGDPRARVETAVRILSRRQRTDGGIGLWSATDWTSPWLSAYAGRVLLEAREAGVAVSDTVMDRLAGYLERELRNPEPFRHAAEPARARHEVQWILRERLAAADLLSRLGSPDVPAENLLLGQAARMTWDDRVALAELLARRGAMQPARRLLDVAWAGVRQRGARAVLPVSAYEDDFCWASRVRPAARLLTATLAIRPDHPLLGPLVETLVQQGRAEAAREWTTQDYGWAVLALARFEGAHRGEPVRRVTLRGGGRVLAETEARRGERSHQLRTLNGVLSTLPDGRKVVRLSLAAASGGAPVFYHAALREVAARPAFTPRDGGIAVERWYETLDTRRPVTRVAEGDVVRVRIRLRVPEDRQMVVLDDPLPAGLEAVDLSLRTVSPFPVGFDEPVAGEAAGESGETEGLFARWSYGSWDSGMWSPFDHKEIRDDRVVYFARTLWRGTYTATYLARATTAGSFVAAPAHAEEMYNPAVYGRSGGGTFTVTTTAP